MKSTIKFLQFAFNCILAVGLTSTGFLKPASGQAIHHPDRPPGLFTSTFINKMQQVIDQYRQNTGAHGVSVAIYANGKSCVLVSGTADEQNKPVTAATGFAMGSIEKVFTTTLLALAIDQGKATLNDHAADYLVAEDGSKVKQGAPFQQITLKELVTHTASLPRKIPGSKRTVAYNFFDGHPVQKSTIQFLNNWQPQWPPGTQYKYSNLSFVLAGTIASKLLGKPYAKILEKDIATPLGMTQTSLVCGASGCAVGYDENGQPSKEKAIGIWTNANDMLRFLEANLGVLQGSPELAKAIEKTHHELFRADSVHSVGMAWERFHRPKGLTISKDGIDSGFDSWIGFQPEKNCGVVVLRNGGKKPLPGELGNKLISLAGGQH